MSPSDSLPPFTVINAPPVQPPDAPARKKAKAPRSKETSRDKKANGVPKVAKTTKSMTARAAAEPVVKRVRTSRVAPLMMDAVTALAALSGLGRKEVETMQAIVALLNPLPRPARQRVMAAVAALLGK